MMTPTSLTLTAEALAAATDTVIQRTLDICRIPAPPFGEQDRTAAVSTWWAEHGMAEVQTDEVGNVWSRLREGAGPALLICAHLDTVFGCEVAHGATWDGTTMTGPGVGDDSVAVAALGVLGDLLPTAMRHPVWAVATVGEEGLGNLRGVTWALDHPPCGIGAVIALEGNYLGRVNVTGVGSARWEIAVRGPGGHAWEDADAPSAVHRVASLIAALDAVARPVGARTSLNVGTLAGGESINSRAQQCTFQLDLRADRADALAALQAAADAVLDAVAPPLSLHRRSLGLRPAGEIPAEHPLVRAAQAGLAAVGITARLTAASTDANAAYARGLPAVTLGITEGDETHTEAEWIRTAPIPDGLTALLRTVVSFDHENW